jgi:hypothetical protein
VAQKPRIVLPAVLKLGRSALRASRRQAPAVALRFAGEGAGMVKGNPEWRARAAGHCSRRPPPATDCQLAGRPQPTCTSEQRLTPGWPQESTGRLSSGALRWSANRHPQQGRSAAAVRGKAQRLIAGRKNPPARLRSGPQRRLPACPGLPALGAVACGAQPGRIRASSRMRSLASRIGALAGDGPTDDYG